MRFFDTNQALGVATSLLVATIAIALVSCDSVSSGSGSTIGDLEASLEITGIQYQNADSVDADGNPMRPDTLSPGDRIAIQGRNMNSVGTVYFLGYEASYNPALASEDNLIVSVPGDLPFGELSVAALDSLDAIRVTNNASEASYNEVPVLPGPPVLQSVTHEHARPGEEVTFYGEGLYLIESVTFPGDVSVGGDEIDFEVDGSAATLTVPEGVDMSASTDPATEGNISITTSSGTDGSARGEGPTFLFHDYRNVLLDMKSDSPAGTVVHQNQPQSDEWMYYWAAHPYSGNWETAREGLVEGAEGDFIVHMQGGNAAEIPAGSGATYSNHRTARLNPGSEWVPPSSTSEQAGNFAVKFEMATTTEWETGAIQILAPGTGYAALLQPWYSEDGGNTPIPNDEWRTYTVPLSAFAAEGGTGSQATNVGTVLGSNGQPGSSENVPGAVLRLINGDPAEVSGAMPAGTKFGVDKFRVVRIAGGE